MRQHGGKECLENQRPLSLTAEPVTHHGRGDEGNEQYSDDHDVRNVRHEHRTLFGAQVDRIVELADEKRDHRRVRVAPGSAYRALPHIALKLLRFCVGDRALFGICVRSSKLDSLRNVRA